MNYPKPSRGMTLVDLLASLGAVTLALALGVPSFHALQTGIQRNQAQYALIGSFNLARAEAIRRRALVTVCRSVDGKTCSGASQLDWSVGWIVSLSEQGVPLLLQGFQLPGGTFSLKADHTIGGKVTYGSDGVSRSVGSFVYQDGRETCRLRLIPVGRLEPDQSNPSCL